MPSLFNAPTLDTSSFKRIKHLVESTVGIQLAANKRSLVESRLAKRLRELAMDSYAGYCDRLEGPAGGHELALLLDAISTNVTSFFRERLGLDMLAEDFRRRLAAGQRRFRYWSAANSSGEEVYSLAMLLAEAGALGQQLDLAILGTDINTEVLKQAEQAVYGPKVAAGIPPDLRQRYTVPSDGGGVHIIPALRQMMTFNRLNLVKPPYPMRGTFDGILCRNVMIYFDQATRDGIIQRLCSLLNPGGILVTGQAESVVGRHKQLRSLKPSVYQRT